MRSNFYNLRHKLHLARAPEEKQDILIILRISLHIRIQTPKKKKKKKSEAFPYVGRFVILVYFVEAWSFQSYFIWQIGKAILSDT